MMEAIVGWFLCLLGGLAYRQYEKRNLMKGK